MRLPSPCRQLILEQKDWNLIRGENEDGFTTLEFWRKWVTCDDLDRDIEVSMGRTLNFMRERETERD